MGLVYDLKGAQCCPKSVEVLKVTSVEGYQDSLLGKSLAEVPSVSSALPGIAGEDDIMLKIAQLVNDMPS